MLFPLCTIFVFPFIVFIGVYGYTNIFLEYIYVNMHVNPNQFFINVLVNLYMFVESNNNNNKKMVLYDFFDQLKSSLKVKCKSLIHATA